MSKFSAANQSTALPKSRLRYWAAVLCGVAVTIVALWAARWQDRRADYKRGLQAQVQAAQQLPSLNLNRESIPANASWRRVKASGVWLPAKAVFLDNRIYKGQPGREVLMPLDLGNGQAVLVNRGWTPQAAGQRSQLPAVKTASDTVLLQGILIDRLPRYSGWGDQYPPHLPALWPNFDSAAYAQASGLLVLNGVMLQTSAAPDGLTRDWPAPASDVDRHLGYRFQWLAIALLAAGLTLYFGTSPWRKKNT
jgi:surfeit locus 1 family protein